MYIPTPQQLLTKATQMHEDILNSAQKLRQGGNDNAADQMLNSLQPLKQAIVYIGKATTCPRGRN